MSQVKRGSLLSWLDRFPPCLCRLIARKGRRPMSTRELAKASGLTISIVSTLSYKTSWATVNASHIERFTKACGVDHLHARGLMDYLRRSQMPHLFKPRNREQKKMIARLLLLHK